MLNKVKAYISKNRLLSDSSYIVALSGGADSVCLLRCLKELGYKIDAAHCNFKLRGEESDRDEAFCEKLCREQDVPFHRIHFDTESYAQLHKVSIEMAARELRYSYFERLRLAIGAEDIVVAHHRDDNIETLLLNIIRGTGIRGIEGMKPRNGHIVRPLLSVSKEDILSYLDSIHQDYIIDSSNLEADVQRNKIRLNIIPLLKDVNPAAMDKIQHSMENFSEAVTVYDAAIEKSKDECLNGSVISIPKLRHQISPESTLFEIATTFGMPSNTVREIYHALDAPSGKIWQWGDYTCAKDRDTLIIDKTPKPISDINIPEIGNYSFDTCTMTIEICERTEDFIPSKDPLCVSLDADKIKFPLILRQVKVGDSFQPYGMKGCKLVSDYLTDVKMNWFEKHSQMVLEDASGEISWLVGRRTSQKFSVTKDTINVLSIRYSKK